MEVERSAELEKIIRWSFSNYGGRGAGAREAVETGKLVVCWRRRLGLVPEVMDNGNRGRGIRCIGATSGTAHLWRCLFELIRHGEVPAISQEKSVFHKSVWGSYINKCMPP